MDINFWLVNLVYPIIAVIVTLVIGSLILIPVSGRRYGFTVKESFRAVLLKK